MKLKTIALALTATVTFSLTTSLDVAASSRLSNLFDSVQSSDPRITSNEHGNVFTGGNVRIRAARASYDLMSFKPPSITSGCGGIDIFAGSFGLVSKDQLVQTGRALVQGAASYYFGLALSAICPLCNGEMSKLQDDLAQLNQFSRASCEEATSQIREWSENAFGTSLESKVESLNQGRGGLIGSWMGLSDSQVDATQDRNEAQPGTVAGIPTPVAEMSLLGNSTYMVIMNEQLRGEGGDLATGSIFKPGFFADTPLEAVNLFMSLVPTMISIEDSTQDTNFSSHKIAPAFTIKDFFGIEADPTEDPMLTLHACVNSTELSPAARCTNVNEKGGDKLQPLALQIRDLIHGPQGNPNEGIFERILDKDGYRDLTSQQKKIVQMSGGSAHYSAVAIEIMGISRQSVANYLESQILLAIQSAFENELVNLIDEMDAATSHTENPILRDGAIEGFRGLLAEVRKLEAPLKADFDTFRDEISRQAELKVFELHFKNQRNRSR